MYWDVVQVQSIAPRELAVQFADGLSGVVRIDTSFCTGVFNPLLVLKKDTHVYTQLGYLRNTTQLL